MMNNGNENSENILRLFESLVLEEDDDDDDEGEEMLVKKLEIITAILKDEETRSTLTATHWESFTKLVVQVNQTQNTSSYELYTELFRVLRNSCAGCEVNKSLIFKTHPTLDEIVALYEYILTASESDRNFHMPIVTCLQFMVNFVSGSDGTSLLCKNALMEEVLQEEQFRRKLLVEKTESRHFSLASMLLFNCLQSKEALDSVLTSKDLSFLRETSEQLLLNITSNEPFEFSLWIIELLCESNQFVPFVYSDLSEKARLTLLDTVHEMISRSASSQKSELPLHESNFAFLLSQLRENLLSIVKIQPQPQEPTSTEQFVRTPLEIRKLLSLVCELSTSTADNPLVQSLRKDTSLLENLLETLRTLHLLAKTDSTQLSAELRQFEPIRQLKKLDETDKDELFESPSFGFKKDIVRLIGNMCYKCPENQELVGRLEGVPLLLDSCHIDARNPFVMQWAIFAVRNVMENNAKNQERLASVAKDGPIENSTLLSELGLELKDGKLGNKSSENH